MTTIDYEFRVDGRFPERGHEVLCDLSIEEVPHGAVVRGPVIDDSHLHGILEQFHAWGLTVVSAHPVDAPPRRGT